MVEGCDQLHLIRAQEPIAEHVAGHVADTDDREGLAERVDSEF